jgi:hypothetical protein
MKRSLVLLITCLVLLLTPLFVACSPAPPETTTAESSSTALSMQAHSFVTSWHP